MKPVSYGHYSVISDGLNQYNSLTFLFDFDCTITFGKEMFEHDINT